MERVLSITTFGTYRVMHKNVDILGQYCKSEKGTELFRYLLANYGRKISKEEIISLFWPGMNEKRARQNLSSTLYFVRNAFDKALGVGAGKNLCRSSCQMCWIEFDESIYFDALELKKEITLANKTSNINEKVLHLENAVSLYRGDFMQEDEYNDWVVPIRVEYREIAMNAFVELLDILYQKGEYNECMFYTLRLMEIAPYNETGIKYKLRLLKRQGRISEARETYLRYVEHLKKHYDEKFAKDFEDIISSLENIDTQPKKGHDLLEQKGGAALIDVKMFMEFAKFESLKRTSSACILFLQPKGFEKLAERAKKELILLITSALRQGDVVAVNDKNIYILLAEGRKSLANMVENRLKNKEKLNKLLENLDLNSIQSKAFELNTFNDYLIFKSSV
ncbi:AfsR/SARP family transcriptional regulator [Kosmotoga pacifica]|uniref:Bacterial transcriptional activator domain-containing protein n=1 Tax=Kosmotoga pacifica TaxID=1330330 RepID=A0A0G2Z7I0_9BACT|nr:BTAD domain-containing putative transcriptional regulator [Kosmotoga pacifica]AKI97502.1 hypothetical protein IX53_06365 [Kosmotoga pacifica]